MKAEITSVWFTMDHQGLTENLKNSSQSKNFLKKVNECSKDFQYLLYAGLVFTMFSMTVTEEYVFRRHDVTSIKK